MAKRQPPFAKTTSANGTFVAPSENSLSLDQLTRYAQRWLRDCITRGCSDRTIENRQDRIDALIWFLKKENLEICDEDALRDFLCYLRTGHKDPGGRFGNPRLTKPASSGTVKTYYITLCTFFNFCREQEVLLCSPMARISAPVDRPDQIKPFSEEDCERLLAASCRTRHPRRDEAIVLLLLDTGIRATELCSLKVGDIDFDRDDLTVEGKGGKKRHVPICGETRKALYRYLQERGGPPSHEPLFLSDRGVDAGGQFTRHGLRFLIRRICQSAKITGVRCSPHTLRHTFAILYLRSGGQAFWVKTMLGHESLTMTNRYVQVAEADLVAHHQTCSPITRLRGKRRR